jgi:hypothetical protein
MRQRKVQTPPPIDTAAVLKQMLTENTGASFLDSGSAYGRNWERNQGRSFDREPATRIRFHANADGSGEAELTHSAYHWLLEKVDFAPKLDAQFTEFAVIAGENWLTLMQTFPAWLEEQIGTEVDFEGTVNTYNGEDLLSQTLQYGCFYVKGDGFYVLLQIHGGCDVRGGYTKPRVFRTEEGYLFGNADATITCDRRNDERQLHLIAGAGDRRPHYWSTDDGGHYYESGSSAGMNLERFHWQRIANGEAPVAGAVSVDEDGNGFCPRCGSKLKAYF